MSESVLLWIDSLTYWQCLIVTVGAITFVCIGIGLPASWLLKADDNNKEDRMEQNERPIDANALLETVTKIAAEAGTPEEKVGRIIIAITEAPTVDAKEVDHGGE